MSLVTDKSIDPKDDEWPHLMPNKLELLTNVHDGFERAYFYDFSNFFEPELEPGPLDVALEILNHALSDKWEQKVEVVRLSDQDGVYELVVVANDDSSQRTEPEAPLKNTL